MASTKRKRPSRKRSQNEPRPGNWNDVIAFALIGLAILHFLALASYNPYDLPTWVFFSRTDVPNDPVQNFIGPFGAIFAGYSYFIFGAAAYLIPVCVIWFGVSKLLSQLYITRRALIGFAILVVSGACLIQLQTIFLSGWHDQYMSLGPGGGIGFVIGERIAAGLIGSVGAFLLLSIAYLIGTIMLTGFHPIAFLRIAKEGFIQWMHDRAERRRELELAFATTTQTSLAGIADSAKKSRRKPKRSPKKESPKDDPHADEFSPDSDPIADLEIDPSITPPRIIDASAPVLASASDDKKGKKKPTLEEIRAQLRKKREGRVKPHVPTQDLDTAFADYALPPMDILHYDENTQHNPTDHEALLELQTTIVRTLATFGITVTPGDITRGPTITRYEILPSEGLRVNRITNLEADIARATRAESINIIAPIPGRDTVGIEIANRDRITVTLRELLDSKEFQNTKAKLPLALGKDVYGKTIIGDLAAMPHLLVSGATGAGKSVCINGLITSLLYKYSPADLRFIMVDPKVVEMQAYKDLPHLAIPLVTDPGKVLLALRWVVKEMENRYQIFKKTGCKDFTSFNARQKKEAAKKKADKNQPELDFEGTNQEESNPETSTLPGEPLFDALGDPHDDETPDAVTDSVSSMTVASAAAHPLHLNNHDGSADYAPPVAPDPADEIEIPEKLPYIVVIIDELADLMDTSGPDVELAIVRIAQMARASGIHLILATQTPRSEVITGRIRANVPTKIAFKVSSAIESRVILEQKGAERLVGKGDMLYLAPGGSSLTRAQGALVTEDEVEELVSFVAEQGDPIFATTVDDVSNDDHGMDEDLSPEDEDTLEKCIDVLRQEEKASASMLQRRLRLGYNRASRMMDILEERGIVGPAEGAKPREILVDLNGPV